MSCGGLSDGRPQQVGQPGAVEVVRSGEHPQSRHHNTTFPTNRPGYNPNDKGMSSVHCHFQS